MLPELTLPKIADGPWGEIKKLRYETPRLHAVAVGGVPMLVFPKRAAAAKPSKVSHYRTLEWSDQVTVRAGWWLLSCAEACDLFESEQRQVGRNVLTLPKIADGPWGEIKKLREELSLASPKGAGSKPIDRRHRLISFVALFCSPC